MTVQNRTVLKSYFQRGLRPTQDNYGDLIDSFALVSTSAEYVQITGGTMTGPLTLYATPSAAAPDLQAATKLYVDAAVSGVANPPFSDATALVKGSVDDTKLLRMEVDGFTAGTTRVATWPNKNGTVAMIGDSVATVQRQVFTSNGTYTPSTGMLYCDVEVWGGGGGGGGSGTSGVAGGGGAGGYARELITAATIGVNQVVTIGAGGTAGANTGGNGGTGGTTSLGALIQATGGAGGVGSTSGNVQSLGGAGGAGSGGNINATGQVGGAAVPFSGGGATGASGCGGTTTLGGNGAPVNGGAGGTGTAGNNGVANSGSGGSGSASNGVAAVGGVGGSGYIVITEYCSQ